MTLKGKTFRKWASGQNIYEFEKEISPKGYSDLVLGLYTCMAFIVRQDIHVYLRSAFTGPLVLWYFMLLPNKLLYFMLLPNKQLHLESCNLSYIACIGLTSSKLYLFTYLYSINYSGD